MQLWNQRGDGIHRGRKRPRAVGAAEGLGEGQVAKHLQRKK